MSVEIKFTIRHYIALKSLTFDEAKKLWLYIYYKHKVCNESSKE